MSFRYMMAIVGCILLMALPFGTAAATVRVSHDDGRWDEVYWMPEGMPEPGDTLVIASSVRGLPSYMLGRLVIRPGGTLRLEGGMALVSGLANLGAIILDRSSVLAVAGDILNDGTIEGEGVTRMARDGGTIGGNGTFGHLLVSADSGAAISLDAPLAVPSLTLAAWNRLLTGEHELKVDGPYSSASPFGAPGIVGGSGVIRLNGDVYGSASGDIVLGPLPASVRRSRRAGYPAVHGMLGDSIGTVRFSASRRISFSTLMGAVTIDSAVVLEGTGIGEHGTNRVIGAMEVNGTLRAENGGYRWEIEGEIYNNGIIEECTIAMAGYRSLVRSGSGLWDPGISLSYIAPSGGELRIEGDLTLSRLAIGALTPLDSNIAVIADNNVLKIRHSFRSDMARGCRIISDTLVRIWGSASGAVEGSVIFEGFWGSAIDGRYGAPGREVRFAVRKETGAGLSVAGTLVTDSPAPLTLNGDLAVTGNALLKGIVTLPAGNRITLGGDLRVERGIHGGGTLALLGPSPALHGAGALEDSLLLEIGTDSTITLATLFGTLRAPALLIHPGSSLGYHTGDSVLLAGALRYGVSYMAGYNTVSAAADPADPRDTVVFPGASSSLLRYEEGYIAADTVLAGAGYYVRFPGAVTITQTGRFINLPLSIPVRAGWNLIGGASARVSVDDIEVTGTTLLSGFVTTLGGAQAVTAIEPGRGYWVNVAGEGTITLRGAP